jgi:hypothetical protein
MSLLMNPDHKDAKEMQRSYVFRSTISTKWWWAFLGLALSVFHASSRAFPHEVWIEAPSRANKGEPVEVIVCFGHPGQVENEEMLAAYFQRVSANVICPRGEAQELTLRIGPRGYMGHFRPEEEGRYLVAAQLEVGITKGPFHSIPADTRILMLGTASVEVGEGGREFPASGSTQPIEIVRSTPTEELRPGGTVVCRLVKQSEPFGGPEVPVSLYTAGSFDWHGLELSATHWSIQAIPHPQTGKLVLPILAPGQHLYLLRYVEEKPGIYEGRHEFATSFSFLKPGAAFARTLYVVTHTFEVLPGDHN